MVQSQTAIRITTPLHLLRGTVQVSVGRTGAATFNADPPRSGVHIPLSQRDPLFFFLLVDRIGTTMF